MEEYSTSIFLHVHSVNQTKVKTNPIFSFNVRNNFAQRQALLNRNKEMEPNIEKF